MHHCTAGSLGRRHSSRLGVRPSRLHTHGLAIHWCSRRGHGFLRLVVVAVDVVPPAVVQPVAVLGLEGPQRRQARVEVAAVEEVFKLRRGRGRADDFGSGQRPWRDRSGRPTRLRCGAGVRGFLDLRRLAANLLVSLPGLLLTGEVAVGYLESKPLTAHKAVHL